MLHPSTKKLIDRLCEMTLQRKIDWVSGEQPSVLAYDTEGYRVLLDGNPAALSLCDALGNELERASQADIAATQHIDGGTYETVLETMRADADRIARGTEGAIASVLGSLDLDASTTRPEPAQTVLEEAPDGLTDDISDQIEDTTDTIGTLSTDMPEAFEETIDQVDAPQIDTLLETPELETPEMVDMDTKTDLPDEVDLPNIESVAETMREDIPSMENLTEGSEDIEKAVANLADQVNNAPQAEDIIPPKDEMLSDAATATLLGGAALVGGAMLGQEGPADIPAQAAPQTDTLETEIAEAEEQTEAASTLQQGAGFISLSGLASGNNGFVTPIITDTIATGEAVQSEPVAEVMEATPELPETASEPALVDTHPLSAETIEAPGAATPEDEIIAKLDEFIEPETPAQTVATPEIAPEYIEPEISTPVSPADPSPEEPVEAPVAPPAPAPEDTVAETESAPEAEEKPEKAPNKRFNPWI